MYPSKTEDKSNIAYIFFVVMASLLILILSVARASLQISAQENDGDLVRVQNVQLTVFNIDGSTEPVNYKLPNVGMLPNNPFYAFKALRDWLWINMSRSSLDKSKITLLVADKKIMEARILFKDNAPGPALEAANEALSKLGNVVSEIAKVEGNVDEVNQIKVQIRNAGLAYKEIATEGKDSFSMDTDKYNKLITDLDNWNESQAKKEE